jgi:outer membrane lipoprotein carrier protein
VRRAAACAAILALGGLRHGVAAQQSPGTVVVTRATRAYQALSSFQAQFVQHYDDRYGDPIPDAKGTLYQEGKTHFAMRFSDPPKDALIADGTYFWMYLPSTSPGKVLRFPQQSHPTYGTNLLGTFLDNAVDRYRITYVAFETIDGHVTDEVIMEPIANDMPFIRATIWFDRDLNLPRRLDIQETRDHHRVLSLSQLRPNESIPAGIFQFNPPAGVKTVTQ